MGAGRLRAAAEHLDADSHWQQLAVAALIEEVYGHQLSLANHVLDFAGSNRDCDKAITGWIRKNEDAVAPTEQLLSELWTTEIDDISMIAVASRSLRAMTDTSPG